MITREKTGGIPINIKETTGRQMVAAFIAGMVMTAALAQTPAIAEMFSRGVNHSPAIPAQPLRQDSLKPGAGPDADHPAEPYLYELVSTRTVETASAG